MIKVRKADKATQRTSRCNSDPGSNRFDLAIMRASRLNMRLHVRRFFKHINEKSTNPIFWSVMPITNRGFSVRQRPARRGIDDRNEWTDLPRDVPRAALALGVSTETLQNGLRSFPGLAHRMEQVGRRGHVLFVNDSKGTNADAAAHALSSFADIFWIAGGKPKLGGITGLSEYFPRIRKAYLIGEAAQEFSATLGDRVPHEISETLEVAVANAARDAEASGLADPVVLLSPACASFDQYRNFEIRGAAFRDAVMKLDGVKPVV